ncbi:predicted protein [Nematostella vectensis]|uniref:Methyltransferase FkbM domain-containing protein n=1 Tax=Nematostella vectensis TaxID=45351 RepID=A8DWR3_NEMVE|nr:predicted protein [Nematostella vectensis]|eukprot:XP_001617447.1 hypothetical protein NEMVEDRAFT_v1g226072 [Nematostella vectensis]
MEKTGIDVVYPYNLVSIYGTYELPTFLTFCQRYLDGSGVALDVGGNTGITGSILSAFTSHVHIFEANPEMEKHIHISNNGNDNVTVVMKAVSNLPGKVEIYPVGQNNTSMVSKSKEGAVSVDCITLDHYCNENNLSPKVIKVDVEGVDSEVLLGTVDTITRCKPYLFLEHPMYNAKSYNTDIALVNKAMAFLKENYELYAYPTLDQICPADSFGLPLDIFVEKAGVLPTNIVGVPMNMKSDR